MRFRRTILIGAVGLAVAFAGERRGCAASGSPIELSDKREEQRTVLGIQGSRFTINGKPTFLLGISYYSGLGASEDSLRRDLEDLQRLGFNWLRVWATCGFFDQDISVVNAGGRPREPQLDKLKRLVADCDRRGLVVDVTLTRAGKTPGWGLPNLKAHQGAVETLVTELRKHPNWYLDLANERDVRDDRYVPASELKTLRELVRRLDPPRLVTASFGGHDLTEEDLRDSLETACLDFLTPHRPRNPGSPGQTEARTREYLGMLKTMGRQVPVHYQEPLRRGYVQFNPSSTDLLADLRGSLSGGAAGWCFHNGSERETPENRPRRSFDLRDQRLFEQLDKEEQIVARGASLEVKRLATDEAYRKPSSP
jgi:hypothetical protein